MKGGVFSQHLCITTHQLPLFPLFLHPALKLLPFPWSPHPSPALSFLNTLSGLWAKEVNASSLFFFFFWSLSLLSQSSFFSQSTIIASFHHWPLEQEEIWQTAMNALYLLKERMHEENNSFIFLMLKSKMLHLLSWQRWPVTVISKL